MLCAVCGVELVTSDAEFAIVTDLGVAHRECYDGEAGAEGDFLGLLGEEEERRREMGDPPVRDDTSIDSLLEREAAAVAIGADDDGLDWYDPEEERTQREIRETKGVERWPTPTARFAAPRPTLPMVKSAGTAAKLPPP